MDLAAKLNAFGNRTQYLQNEGFLHHALVGIYFKADGITGFVGCRGDADIKGLGVI